MRLCTVWDFVPQCIAPNLSSVMNKPEACQPWITWQKTGLRCKSMYEVTADYLLNQACNILRPLHYTTVWSVEHCMLFHSLRLIQTKSINVNCLQNFKGIFHPKNCHDLLPVVSSVFRDPINFNCMVKKSWNL